MTFNAYPTVLLIFFSLSSQPSLKLVVYKAVLCSLAQLFQNSGNKSWISSAFCVSYIKFLFKEEKNILVEKKLKSYFEFFTIIFPINSCNAPRI